MTVMNRREGNRRVDRHVQAVDAIEDLLFRKIPQGLLQVSANQIQYLYRVREWHRQCIEAIITEFSLDEITPEDLEGTVWDEALSDIDFDGI